MVKGGVEVLNLVAGPKESVELEINCFLTPSAQSLAPTKDPTWLTSAIPLNKIPIQAQGERLKIWELYKVKTGTFCTTTLTSQTLNADQPVNGPWGQTWGVSGLPLTGYPVSPTKTDPPFDGGDPPVSLLTSESMTIKQFNPNPWMENAKYYTQNSRGGSPFSSGDNNSTVVLLADEYGFGVMCPEGFCYISAADYMSQYHEAGTSPNPTYPYYVSFPLPRYFTLYLRQRWIKSPVILSDLFQQSIAHVAKGFQGETDNVEMVTLGWGSGRTGPSGMLNSSGVNPAYSGGAQSLKSSSALKLQRASDEEMSDDEPQPPHHPNVAPTKIPHLIKHLPAGVEVHWAPPVPPKKAAAKKETTK